jgi:hypothetical protein
VEGRIKRIISKNVLFFKTFFKKTPIISKQKRKIYLDLKTYKVRPKKISIRKLKNLKKTVLYHLKGATRTEK